MTNQLKISMKNSTPTPEEVALRFIERKTVPAKGKCIGAFSLYYLYSRHARLVAPFRAVSTKRFYLILKKLGYRRRLDERGHAYKNLTFNTGATS